MSDFRGFDMLAEPEPRWPEWLDRWERDARDARALSRPALLSDLVMKQYVNVIREQFHRPSLLTPADDYYHTPPSIEARVALRRARRYGV